MDRESVCLSLCGFVHLLVLSVLCIQNEARDEIRLIAGITHILSLHFRQRQPHAENESICCGRLSIPSGYRPGNRRTQQWSTSRIIRDTTSIIGFRQSFSRAGVVYIVYAKAASVIQDWGGFAPLKENNCTAEGF